MGPGGGGYRIWVNGCVPSGKVKRGNSGHSSVSQLFSSDEQACATVQSV